MNTQNTCVHTCVARKIAQVLKTIWRALKPDQQGLSSSICLEFNYAWTQVFCVYTYFLDSSNT